MPFVTEIEPVKYMLPLFCTLVAIKVSIVSLLLPDFLKNTLPSGTFIAN